MKILTQDKFSNQVKALVLNGETYIDAVLHVCEKYDIDPSSANRYLDSNLLSKIQEEAKKRKLIKIDNKSIDICQ